MKPTTSTPSHGSGLGKLSAEELLAQIAARCVAYEQNADAAADRAAADSQARYREWLDDVALAEELDAIDEAARSPLLGEGKWLAGALLAAAAVVVLALAWVERA